MKTSAVLADICPIIGILANIPENYRILRVQFRPDVHLILHQLLGSCSIFSDGKVEHEISQRAVDSVLAAVCSRALRSEEGRREFPPDSLDGNEYVIWGGRQGDAAAVPVQRRGGMCVQYSPPSQYYTVWYSLGSAIVAVVPRVVYYRRLCREPARAVRRCFYLSHSLIVL